jgi:hypothetical protein
MTTHRTLKGSVIDMEALRISNDKSVAVGNMSINAKGDLLGKGGEIVQTSQERTQQYYKGNPKAVKNVSLKQPVTATATTVAVADEAPAATVKPTTGKKKAKEIELEDGSLQVIDPETDEGNQL